VVETLRGTAVLLNDHSQSCLALNKFAIAAPKIRVSAVRFRPWPLRVIPLKNIILTDGLPPRGGGFRNLAPDQHLSFSAYATQVRLSEGEPEPSVMYSAISISSVAERGSLFLSHAMEDPIVFPSSTLKYLK
jgi:hypothetical protein